MKKSLLFMAALSAATFCASAQDALPEGEVYIRNVKTGFYLNNGYTGVQKPFSNLRLAHSSWWKTVQATAPST